MASGPSEPRNRNDLMIAIVCALPLEAEMVRDVFDQEWKHLNLGRALGDHNSYTLGVIGRHNVVLVHMPGIGNIDAANAAGSLKRSFPNIAIVFVTWICGASPKHIETKNNIVLGDFIVSTALVQFDFGRRYPGEFTAKSDIEHVLGRAGPTARSFLAKLQTSQTMVSVEEGLALHLDQLQKRNHKASNPGPGRDRRFDSSYLHTHHDGETCEKCLENTGICSRECDELGCQEERPAKRARLMSDNHSDIAHEVLENRRLPRLHFGRYGSTNTVLRSGLDRDKLVAKYKLIAFEMEGAGFWENTPTLIIKSACDYADSHKNKEWQEYAAAVAAAGLKSVLEELELLGETERDARPQASDSGITEAIHAADEAIRSYYNSSARLEIERLSGEKLPLDQCYINLGLMTKLNQNQENENEASFSLEKRLRISTTKAEDSLSLESLFEKKRLTDGKAVIPRRIFIEGRAGIGKTTLCKKIVHEFQNNKLWTNLFDRLLWIPFRSLKSSNTRFGWQDLLQDIYSPRVEDWTGLSNAMSRQLLKRDFLNRTLLLFDGLDEINHRWTREDKMFEFIEGVICDAPNTIITSRPQANSFNVGHFDLELESIGFTPDQIDAYLQHCVKDEYTISKMQVFISQRPLLQGLFRIPIQLDAFCCTWPSRTGSTGHMGNAIQSDQSMAYAEDNISTMTTLYQSITNELYRKDIERLDKAAKAQRLSGFKARSLLNEELLLLEEYAFQGMLNNIINFTPHDRNMVESFISRSRPLASDLDSFVLERLSFLRTSDVEQHYSQKNYHFLHLTFQEFFAARYFVRHWRVDHDLVCLDLRRLNREGSKTMSPTVFLQDRKYDSQFNIFWRFVTGLIQISVEDTKDMPTGALGQSRRNVVKFFNQLDDPPIDLLGPARHRLLVHCLSELLPSDNPEVARLRTEKELILKKCTIREFQLYNTIYLSKEAEFPESVLRDLLEDENGISGGIVLPALGTLEARPFVSIRTLYCVCRYTYDSFSMRMRMAAINTMLKNTRMDTHNLVTQAAQSFSEMTKDQNSTVRESAIESLSTRISLPASVTSALVAALDDEDRNVRRYAATALGRQEPLLSEIIAAQVIIFQDKHGNSNKRQRAAEFLREQWSLPIEVVWSMVVALQDKTEDMDVRAAAAGVLKMQSSLSAEVVAIVIEMLLTEDPETLDCDIGGILREQRDLPTEAINIMVKAFEEDKRLYVREPIAEAFAVQLSLPPEAIAALMKALDEESDVLQLSAIQALQNQGQLSLELISVLITALKDRDTDVRPFAAKGLLSSSPLPPEAITALITALEDPDWYTRVLATSALAKQPSLSPKAIAALTTALEDPDQYTGSHAAEALAKHPSLPLKAIAALTTALENGDTFTRRRAVKVLERQSQLPSDTIRALAAMLENLEWEGIDALCKNRLLQSATSKLSDSAWEALWQHWIWTAFQEDIRCCELEGCLHIWLEGKSHQISKDSSETQRLLRVLQETGSIAHLLASTEPFSCGQRLQ